jgi:hypothetical protein
VRLVPSPEPGKEPGRGLPLPGVSVTRIVKSDADGHEKPSGQVTPLATVRVLGVTGRVRGGVTDDLLMQQAAAAAVQCFCWSLRPDAALSLRSTCWPSLACLQSFSLRHRLSWPVCCLISCFKPDLMRLSAYTGACDVEKFIKKARLNANAMAITIIVNSVNGLDCCSIHQSMPLAAYLVSKNVK